MARVWRTTRAQILISFSGRLVNDQSAMASGNLMQRSKVARLNACECSFSRTSLPLNA